MQNKTLLKELKYLFLLSTPIIITQLARTGMGAIDALMSGHYSTIDLAAVALGGSIWFPIFILGHGVIMMLSADVAKYRSHNNIEEIKECVNNYISASFLLSIPIIIFLFAAVQLLSFIGVDEEVVNITKGYITAMAFGVPGLMLFNVFRSLLQGLEDTKIAMYISCLAFVVNIPVNYAFIFGKFGMPEMGGVGAGIATTLINTLSAIALILYFLYKKEYKQYQFKLSLKFNQKLKQLFSVGIPSGMALFIEVLFLDIIAFGVATLGPVYIAANNITITVASLMFTVTGGFSTVTTVKVSYLNAKRDIQSIFRFSAIATAAAAFIASVLCVLFYLYPYSIISLYTKDILVINAAMSIVIFLCFFHLFDAFQYMLSGIFRGLHETKIVFYAPIIGYWIIGIPLGFILGLTDIITGKMGLVGFWYGLVLGLIINAIILSIILKMKFKRLAK
ncbi:multidrug efflux protein [Xenorhabdus mauleonii]|uniref:Multidrug-efflux transporter n=1 Tax=Xenorhabdus mauleonii TaxID=351675 RepID=A0A1I3JEH5_9GAMM|nr:MATE family efflux transporter [Xenorhabdus mauleonii]PHM46185.1 multidrug efflux protein [Xenorhabdus mauleonii]SFI58677.1 multidrug resistance protein, MATE family [Xenorhabdus mauleonii]